MRALFLLLVGCISSNNGKTLVYALDAEPESRLDRSICATGVGLNIPLELENGISYSVAPDGRDAILGTCTIDTSGIVAQCFTIDPQVVLEPDDAGELVGTTEIPVDITNSDCSGATLDTEWRLVLGEEGRLDGTVRMVWHLDSTAECEDFESGVIAQSPNGLGMEDCLLTHTFSGQLAQRCSVFNGTLDCSPP